MPELASISVFLEYNAVKNCPKADLTRWFVNLFMPCKSVNTSTLLYIIHVA